jgi:hypothetical protein
METSGNRSGTEIAAASILRFEAWEAIAPHKVTVPAKDRHPVTNETANSQGIGTLADVNPRNITLKIELVSTH